MKKLYTSPKAEIVNYSTPDVVQINTTSMFDFSKNATKNTISYENISF